MICFMELTQLLQFKTIAKCKTMHEAAKRLHISQPALSFSLKKLEDELGVRLFERRKNRIFLNQAGQLALTHACAVIGQAEEMKNAFRAYGQSNDVLFLGFCDAGPMRMSVPLLRKTYPELNLSAEITEDGVSVLDGLLAKKYDAVVSLEKAEHQDVVCIPFAREELMLSLAEDDPLVGEAAVCLHEHTDREIAAYRIFGAYERKIQGFLDWLGGLPSVTVYTDYFVFRQMLEHKKVLTFTTRLVQLYRNDGKRVIVPLTDGGISAFYWFIYRRGDEKRLERVICWLEDSRLMLLGSENGNIINK